MKDRTLPSNSITEVPEESEVRCPTCGRDDFKNELGMKRHHAYKHGTSLSTVTLTCVNCGGDYERRQDQADNSRFCSKKCQRDWDPSDGSKIECEQCGESFTTKRALNVHQTKTHEQGLSNPELLRDLREAATRLGHTPTRDEFNEFGSYRSVSVYSSRFGSWNAALEKAELELNHEHNIPKSKLIAEVERLAAEKGKTPTLSEFARKAPYSSGVIYRKFASWNELLKQAGLEANQRKDITDEELKREMRRLTAELGHPPSQHHMTARGEFSFKTYQERFGSWTEAKEAAGVSSAIIKPGRRVDVEECLDALREVCESLGRAPRHKEFDEQSDYHPDTIAKTVGSWREALERVGYEWQAPTGEDHPNWKGGHVKYYGANWKQQRRKALERDDYRCQTEGCEIQESDHLDIFGESIHVHHITPMREYKEEYDAPTWWEKGNGLNNLITLCKSHHSDWERIAPLSFDRTPHPDS